MWFEFKQLSLLFGGIYYSPCIIISRNSWRHHLKEREKAIAVISSTEFYRTYFLVLFDLSRNGSHISAEWLNDLKGLLQVKPKVSISFSKGETLCKQNKSAYFKHYANALWFENSGWHGIQN